MLVLSRNVGQSICINGHEIIVQVVDIRGDKVRLGIQAPPHMTVHREEVQQRIERKRQDVKAERQGFKSCPPGDSLGRMPSRKECGDVS